MLNSRQVKLRIAKQTKLVAKMNGLSKKYYEAFKNNKDYSKSDELAEKMFTSQMEHSCAEQVLFALTTTLEKVIEIETELKKCF